MDLKGKRIILVTSMLFNYHLQIKECFEKMGAVVHLYDERNNPSSIEKILIRKARFLMRHRIKVYYSDICRRERDFNPDYIVFISPEAVTKNALNEMKSTFPNSYFILYMWDSVKNKHANDILNSFDRRCSFDSADCKKYNMVFRPLFFSDGFRDDMKDKQYRYDICFVGTVHSDRARIIWDLKEYCDANNMHYYFYLYVPGKLLYFLRRITDSYFRKLEKYIHIDSLDNSEVARVSSLSRCIIDINHPSQTGLTMRTIEMLGLNRKIATTNFNIREYDFYRPENQMVLERKNASIDKKMLRQDYSVIPNDIYLRYSIQYWARDLFGINGEEIDYGK